MHKEKILIVDDKLTICQVLSDFLITENYDAITAHSGEEGMRQFYTESPDMILTDLKMSGMSGIDIIKEIRKINESIPIILLTAFGTISSAVEAIKAGANDYLTKPLNYEILKLKIEKLFDEKKLILENRTLKENLKSQWGLDNMLGKSIQMEKIHSLIRTVAPTESRVLITGECGTGKELIARSLYLNSQRANGPFVVVDCSAIPEGLIESELFGYEKGAFSGAEKLKEGRIENAKNGTLFLDEIGELPLSLQAKLLRVIQERQFVRIGGNRQIHVDFRLMAATNKNLKDEVSKGNFRSDLYYRLNVINVESPPLRNRMEDIPLLIDAFLKTSQEENNLSPRQIEESQISLMMNYSWPGNIRELKNAVEHLAILGTLPKEITNQVEMKDQKETSNLLSDREREVVQMALRKTSWNISKAAQDLGIGRKALYNRIKKYNITAP